PVRESAGLLIPPSRTPGVIDLATKVILPRLVLAGAAFFILADRGQRDAAFTRGADRVMADLAGGVADLPVTLRATATVRGLLLGHMLAPPEPGAGDGEGDCGERDEPEHASPPGEPVRHRPRPSEAGGPFVDDLPFLVEEDGDGVPATL